MEQTGKQNVIRKIRTCSTVMGIFCLLTAVIQGISVVELMTSEQPFVQNDVLIQMNILRIKISTALSMVILLLTAALCFKMRSSGRPFTARKSKLVYGIAALVLLKAVITAVIQASIVGRWYTGILTAFSSGTLAEGLLILFIALLMHYGAMLQQESDETL